MLTILIPVKNLAKHQTIGLTNVACIKILKDAVDAKAAKTLMCPTLETKFGTMFAPIKYPIKYADIKIPVDSKVNSSITERTPNKLPCKPKASIMSP